MRLALAQLEAAEDPSSGLEWALETLEAAAARGADLVVFPELAGIPFFPARPDDPRAEEWAEEIPGPTTRRLAEAAREHGLVIVWNQYERDGDACYDASPVIDADGTLLGVVRMLHVPDYEGFHERRYYARPPAELQVFDTRAGRIGVAICYDRHYPEVLRGLALRGADLICVPQAGCVDEWPEGLFEAEMRVAAFQNGIWTALCNRVGVEPELTFAGESFVSDPEGRVVARGARLEDDLVVVDVDLSAGERSPGRRLLRADRRPEAYASWVAPEVGTAVGNSKTEGER